MKILIATHNPHKGAELASILSTIEGVTVMTLADLRETPAEPTEDGRTLEENAYIKAYEIFQSTGIPTLADDTGLEVRALDGAPGVHSARYAGEKATYDDNCTKLLSELGDAADRTAGFRTVICYVDHYRTLFAEGSVDGEITTERRGDAGFGYDPLFLPNGSSKTFAELSPDVKNSSSHRARAIAAIVERLTPYLREMGGC
jgi:XTP/dITP diphosphohydrolase